MIISRLEAIIAFGHDVTHNDLIISGVYLLKCSWLCSADIASKYKRCGQSSLPVKFSLNCEEVKEDSLMAGRRDDTPSSSTGDGELQTQLGGHSLTPPYPPY